MADTQAIFNRVARHYDALNNWLSWGQHWIWKHMVIGWVAPQPGETAVDLCCGTGDLTGLLARKIGAAGKVWGIDFAEAMLAIARQRYAHLPICWYEGDVLQLPFPDQSVDVVTMGYGLRNVTDRLGCLREIYRVLRPGGRAAILDFHQPRDPWLRAWQAWYLQQVVVPVASGLGLADEYAYIWPSLQTFPPGEQQVAWARDCGFQACHYPIANGLMGVLVLRRP
ncbi:MAG: bifunctional demethylmenaquinone methyltransferase/2-methoxy-6-polyprenyl-1,4-benzoquinol methylase UbiE [Gloeomargarita sp. SKYG116]|nr:bifunctional demethylmenaquinone methyltransferase/2-methoxy-6-polyprenyl-1,4-benzoquinol methylase UbiE [Gloeomargarita sp. SKYG116]MCS7225773.1 bifunctional demethylmenaquinone methyltransferase/2-methoxy-6-polyprenyl-1,4-benzoquinol methylase UbiE [Gloeomargarita sp. SKYB31]MDW8401402.1 bifunctional demethylmenaquinone methyltransferase/2-methoxy-6-polyprenyl-1,4-benzoquinol methylase UbiE [Gloeomargarita sp. SKYGB_i_bin116]